MPTYRFQPCELPLDDSWDVIVVGGGPAGCAAAAAAAREGARTLLLEATGCLGGMGTAGLVNYWMTWGDGEKPIIRGLAERVYRACVDGMPHADPRELSGPIDAELLKRIYDDLVTGAGARVLFNSMLASVETRDGGVETLIVANKAGLTAYRAKSYVDCSGDADLATWAGAEFVQGEPGSGDLMPVSHCFVLTNVDGYAFTHGRKIWPEVMTEIVNSGAYPEIATRHCCSSFIGPSAIGFNAGHQWEVDNTRPETVSAALIQGRKIAKAFRDALAEYLPAAFANAFLTSTGSLLGVREGRRIIGDYCLTTEDYFARRSFADEICRNHYPIDIHTARHEAAAEKAGEFEIINRFEHFKSGESHGIPYRCLCPRGVRNVLVAGRSVSCERPVQAAIRIMPVCLGMGEAAGLAAALAARETSDVHAVDTDHLRCRLREEGGFLPEAGC